MNKEILLSTAYLAPIQYYTKLLVYKNIWIEAHENFIKQTYRNRCKIYGANGELQLTIPVNKLETKTKISDLLISYDSNWQKLHWKSIESAYNSSPFFEYYMDDFIPYYRKKYKYLLDFNLELQQTILDILDIEIDIRLTERYIKSELYQGDDFREKILPKKQMDDPDFIVNEYTQVFQEKYGFIRNLSIIDLIFNEGPNTLSILKST